MIGAKNKSSNIRTAEKGPSGMSVPEGLFVYGKHEMGIPIRKGDGVKSALDSSLEELPYRERRTKGSGVHLTIPSVLVTKPSEESV